LAPVYFPPGKAANVLRGALGRELLAAGGQAVYERLFAPVAAQGGPSGLRTPPRPFVLRAAHLDGRHFSPGEIISFGLHLFTANPEDPELLAGALERAAAAGLGPAAGELALLSVETGAVPIPLTAETDAPRAVTVEFVTPIDLRAGDYTGQSAPPFAVLFARIRDRIGNLASFYGGAPLPLDFAAIGRRAESVQLTAADVHPVRRERRSGSTGQSHPIGGVSGRCTYEGELGEFLPFLRAARWTGAGKHAAWGNGEIHIR
jgi:hypothetical protein